MARKSPRGRHHHLLTPVNTKFVVGNGDYPSLELSSGSENEGPSDEEEADNIKDHLDDDVDEEKADVPWGTHHRYQNAVRGNNLRRHNNGAMPPPPPPPPPPLPSRTGGHHHHSYHHHPQRYLLQYQQHQHQPAQQQQVRYNRIQLHIYDLIASDTLMQLPWGCICEIGKCFNDVNSALHELGTGAYHVGVDVNGVEYAFGATSIPGKSGVFSCIPKLSPGYQYRTSIHFGNVPLVRTSYIKTTTSSTSSSGGGGGMPPTDSDHPKTATPNASTTTAHLRRIDEYVDGKVVIKEMATEYMGADYNILRRNCCTFAYEACVRLGIPPDQIPTWFRNLAETGAYSQDIANSTIVEPLKRVLSHTPTAPSPNVFSFFADPQDGNNSVLLTTAADDSTTSKCSSTRRSGSERECFEMVTRRNEANTRDVVVVLRSEPSFVVAASSPPSSARLQRPRSSASGFY